MVLVQSSAALLPCLPLCCQPRQSPLPSPRDETLHKLPFFWHVLRGQRVPSTRGHPWSPPSCGAEPAASSQVARRRGEERGCARPARDAQTLCSGWNLQIFPTHHPRGRPEGCSGPCPAPCCPGEAVAVVQGAHGTEAALLPLLVFSPPQQHAGGLLGRNSYVLADLLYFSKNKQNVLTEKKKYIYFKC